MHLRQKRSEIWTRRVTFLFNKPLSKQNSKRPTKFKMADKIQNGRQEIKSGRYVKKIAKIASNQVKSLIIA